MALQEDIDRLVEETVKEFGTVDILVNNAGIMDKMEPAGDITDEQWERIFAVNVTSVMRTTRKVLPIFLEKEKGNIINIASIGGIWPNSPALPTPQANLPSSASPKSTGSCMPRRLRCNNASLPAQRGKADNIEHDDENIHQFGAERTGPSMALNHARREPEEIAKVALFLASDESSFVNAAVLVADSGWTA